ncbi:hypothetical protein Pelo_16468 [Pelomyxa schiedti]|nr:hypothetical protein Pelo_16468 [Pelomyxa schiedti]
MADQGPPAASVFSQTFARTASRVLSATVSVASTAATAAVSVASSAASAAANTIASNASSLTSSSSTTEPSCAAVACAACSEVFAPSDQKRMCASCSEWFHAKCCSHEVHSSKTPTFVFITTTYTCTLCFYKLLGEYSEADPFALPSEVQNESEPQVPPPVPERPSKPETRRIPPPPPENPPPIPPKTQQASPLENPPPIPPRLNRPQLSESQKPKNLNISGSIAKEASQAAVAMIDNTRVQPPQPQPEKSTLSLSTLASELTEAAEEWKNFFSPVQFEGMPCKACGNPLGSTDTINFENCFYHRLCLCCSVCNTLLPLERVIESDSKFFCLEHYTQMRRSKMQQQPASPEEALPTSADPDAEGYDEDADHKQRAARIKEFMAIPWKPLKWYSRDGTGNKWNIVWTKKFWKEEPPETAADTPNKSTS